MSEWISVDDRLPEIGEYILAFTNCKDTNMSPSDFMICQFTKYGFERSNITHWMPTPEPPEAS